MFRISRKLAMWMLILVTSVSCGSYAKDGGHSLTSRSPNGEYKVLLKETTQSDGNREARFDLLKYDQLRLKDEPLWSGREWDGTFSGGHPDVDWVSGNAIFFGHNVRTQQTQNDMIEIVNNSQMSFRYFGINTGRQNVYLLFDFIPGAKLILSTEPQTDKDADFSEISYWGKLDNGHTLNRGVADFDIKGQYKNPAHYKIIIAEEGVSVTSLNGFKQLK